MAKRARPSTAASATPAGGPRQPCPCGSGKRYKACHGSGSTPYVGRTFAGLAGECDWVAMREFVPAATAPLRLRGEVADGRNVSVCSLLPMALPALVRDDGAVWLGLHVQHNYGDTSRDLAAALQRGLDADPGTQVTMVSDPGRGPRLQDLVDTVEPLEVTVHAGYDYWAAGLDDPDGSIAASLETANAAAAPTQRLSSVEAAYWTAMGGKEFLRWVMPHDEDRLLDALARLHVRGDDALVEGGRLIGSFRAHGLVTPVWELPPGTAAAALDEPALRVGERLTEALTSAGPLSSDERAARNGMANRQLTIR